MINKNKINLETNNNLKRDLRKSYLNPKNSQSKNGLNRQISFNSRPKSLTQRSFKIFSTPSANLTSKTIAAFDDGLTSLVNQNTFINIVIQNSTSGSSMAGAFDALQDLRGDELKSILLPFYGNNESLYNSNVTVRNMQSLTDPGTSTLSKHGPSSRLNGITAKKNSIAIGGLDMVDSSKNVINMMFQDIMSNSSYAPGGTFPDDFDGEPDDDGYSGYAGSIGFMKQGLDFKPNNRAVFFQIGSGIGDGIHVNGSLGTTWRLALKALEASLVGTVYEDKTDFNYNILKGQLKTDFETANPGQNYYASVIIDALNRIA